MLYAVYLVTLEVNGFELDSFTTSCYSQTGDIEIRMTRLTY